LTAGLLTSETVAVSTQDFKTSAGLPINSEVAAFQINPLFGKATNRPVLLSLKLTLLCGHYENPSASPHTLLTVSGITFIIIGASVSDALIV
jgi:hypothetical protein